MASIQFISGKICYNRKNYFKEVLMEFYCLYESARL